MSRSRRATRDKDEDASFVAYIYDTDYKEIQTLVHHYPNIETGGDLFGLWQDERTVIIQQFIGPGKNSKRTTTSFHQDIEYLQKVGSLITTEEGLCNVGEWHSHHQIGMPQPSGADRRTVFSNMPHLGLERFVLFIATIEGKRYPGKKKPHDVKADDVQLRPFLFVGSSTSQDVLEGEIRIIPDSNPHRRNNRIMKEIEAGAEAIPGGAKKVSASSDENYDMTNNSEKKKTTGGKGSKPAQDKAGTKDKSKTLQQEAKESLPQEEELQPPSSKTQPQTTAETAVDNRTRQPPSFSRDTKPREGNGTEPYKNDGSLGRRLRGNQQRENQEQKQYEKTEREKKETEEQRRRNNENCSPNAGHAAQGRGNRGQPSSPPFQTNAPHQSGTTTQSWDPSRNMPPTTSPSTFRKTYEESRQPPGYTQPMSGGSTRGSHKAPAKEGTIPAGKMCAEGYF